jgi:hypothetical protein
MVVNKMEKVILQNNTIYKTTSVVSILLAIGCFEHGLFELLQGYTPTPGYSIQAIGEDIRWWSGGTEEAFTVIPNFLITGIVVIAISLFVAVWSVKYISKEKGGLVFILSFIALTLFGGGVGHIPFYITTWAFTLKGRSHLLWWKTKIKSRSGLEKIRVVWSLLLVVISMLWLLAVEIAVFGYFPRVKEASLLLAICWGALLTTLLLIIIAYMTAMIIDVKQQTA